MAFVTFLLIYLSNKLPTKQCSILKLCEQCIHRYVNIVNLASYYYLLFPRLSPQSIEYSGGLSTLNLVTCHLPPILVRVYPQILHFSSLEARHFCTSFITSILSTVITGIGIPANFNSCEHDLWVRRFTTPSDQDFASTISAQSCMTAFRAIWISLSHPIIKGIILLEPFSPAICIID